MICIKEDEFSEFISYLDDNDKKIDVFVKNITIKDGFVTFTNQSGNELSFPSHRILKIKRKGENN